MYTIYGMPNCKWCDKAQELLTDLSLDYVYHDVQTDIDQQNILLQLYPATSTLPQVFLDGTRIGGYDDLAASLAE